MIVRLLAGLLAALVLGGLAARVAPKALRRNNFRHRSVSLTGGLAAIAAVVVGASTGHATTATLVAALGAGAVGLYDDLRGTHDAQGLGGHLRALRHGTVTTGILKVAGVGAAALVAAAILDGARPRLVLDAVVVAGCANLLNLFDVRPGRALKVALVGAAALVSTDAWLAGIAAGLLPYDLRERTMLGDSGANALGAAIGVTAAHATRDANALAALVAVAVTAAILASERVSFSRVIDAVRPLRWADRLGRPV